MVKAKPKLIAALTCDQVITDKIKESHTLVGLFSDIYAQKFPARHPHMVFFCAWGPSNTPATYNVQVVVKDPDKGNLAKIDVKLELKKGKTRTYAIFNFENLLFNKQGEYTFELRLGGELIAEVPVKASTPPN